MVLVRVKLENMKKIFHLCAELANPKKPHQPSIHAMRVLDTTEFKQVSGGGRARPSPPPPLAPGR